MKNFHSTLLWMAVMAIPFTAYCDSEPTLFNFIQTEGVLEIELHYDFEALEASRKTNEESPAIFRFKKKNGQWQEMLAEVRARGKYRRRICDFVPIKIDFSKKQLRGMGLLPYDDLKLVTHCVSGTKGKDAVLREYLAYRMYAQLTDQAYRAQLVSVTYKDSESRSQHTAYGILLEDIDEIAARTQSVECESCMGISPDQFTQQNLMVHDVFQYMIGNLDYSLKLNRNVKVMQYQQTGRYWIMPYDFDFAGMVEASYAFPNQDYEQKDVKDRIYIGTAFSKAQMEPVRALFMQRKQQILREIDQLELLSNSSRNEIRKYIESFYAELQQGGIGFAESPVPKTVHRVR
jgi:hypothetical protein